MPKRTITATEKRARERIRAIRAAIAQIDYLCSGARLKRVTRCGKAGCRCAHDPVEHHGPYLD
jgi:hypothetical protein